MTNKHRKTTFILLFLILVFVAFTAGGHTPYRPVVVFYNDYPDRPVSQFVAGHFGIMTTELAKSYLVVAYRYFSSDPLSPSEQKSFMAQPNLHPFYALKPLAEDDWKKELRASPMQRWVRARAQFRKEPPPFRFASNSDYTPDWWEYDNGENCQSDAFLTAVRTLRARARIFGPKSQELQEWISGQDQVFLNCQEQNGGTYTVAFPQPVSLTASPLLRADRAYQTAAADFYAGNDNEAISEFQAIAKDPQSPWHEWGSYLAARVVLRSAFYARVLSPPDEGYTFNPERLQEADERFRVVERETQNGSIRRSSRGLLSFIAFRLRPEEQTRAVAQRISRGESGEQFGQNVEDLVLMLQKEFGSIPDFPGINPYSKEYKERARVWRNSRLDALQDLRASSELMDWMYTMTGWAPEFSRRHAIAQWRSRKTLPWLVAAISLVEGSNPATPELIETAAGVSPNSPAYLTLLYHRARLLRERGDLSSARQLLDRALANSQGWPVSSINLLKKERFQAAADLEDLARFAWRQPVGFSNGAMKNGESEYCDPDGWDVKCEPNLFLDPSSKAFLPQLDSDSAITLGEHLPINLLVQLIHSPALPPTLRARMAPAVWSRAAFLDRPELAASVSGEVIAARPELKPYLDSYQRAGSVNERQFLAAYAIAHFPGLRPYVEGPSPRVTRFDYADNYRDNWWCQKSGLNEFLWFDDDGEPVQRPNAVPDPPFLSPDERQAAKLEAQQLAAVASGNWLSDILINWAMAHPQDPHSPEALHFAWRAMRFACDGTTKRSREVVILLHKRYPDSPCTKKTKVW